MGELYDNNGQLSNQSTTSGEWEQRNVDLTPLAGGGITLLAVGMDQGTTGSATIDFADIAIVHSDGTASTVFDGQPMSLSDWWWGNNEMGSPTGTFLTGEPAGSATPLAAHYYLADHLGSTRVEFASGGWPVWSEDYAPYGQEVNPQATSNHYKFTGYERDPETAIAAGTEEDYANARYYSSAIQGRFMSPDPYAGSMDITNPQSLNRYSYALNNPLKFVDPTGADACVYDNGDGTGTVYYDEEGGCGGDGYYIDAGGGGGGDLGGPGTISVSFDDNGDLSWTLDSTAAELNNYTIEGQGGTSTVLQPAGPIGGMVISNSIAPGSNGPGASGGIAPNNPPQPPQPPKKPCPPSARIAGTLKALNGVGDGATFLNLAGIHYAVGTILIAGTCGTPEPGIVAACAAGVFGGGSMYAGGTILARFGYQHMKEEVSAGAKEATCSEVP